MILNRRRITGLVIAVALLGSTASAQEYKAQQTGKVWRIGILFYGSSGAPGPLTSLLDGLRDLGVVEGRTAVFEIRYAEGQTERYSTLAAELVRLPVDLLVAVSTPAIIAAKQATSTIPIVMAAASDPVGTKLVASLAHPGGNITGLSLLAPN